MEIINFLYRKPSYLTKINKDKIDTIVIHHTGNDNDIHINTDYHMDNNRWSWIGYGFVVQDGVSYKCRGFNFQNAAVSGHNDHTVNIAVKGNYDKNIPSQKDIEALQHIIYEIVKECKNIKYIKPHSFFNDTTCCGKLFPLKVLKLNKDNFESKFYDLQEKYNKLVREKENLIRILKRRK